MERYLVAKRKDLNEELKLKFPYSLWQISPRYFQHSFDESPEKLAEYYFKRLRKEHTILGFNPELSGIEVETFCDPEDKTVRVFKVVSLDDEEKERFFKRLGQLEFEFLSEIAEKDE